jgi:hypothetical protein
MSSSQECLGMNRPHKTVEYDLDTVLSKENESSPTIMLETETKPSLTVMSETENGHRANWACKWSGMQSVRSPSRWRRGVHQGWDGIIWIVNHSMQTNQERWQQVHI